MTLRPSRPPADRQVSNGDIHRCNKNFSAADFDWIAADLFYRHVLCHKKETEIRVFLTDPKIREEFREVCRRYGTYISRERSVGSFFVHNPDEFLEVGEKFNGAADIYAGIFERDKREKGTRGGDVSSITHFLMEFDAHGEDGNIEDAKKLAHRAIKELEEKYGQLEWILFFSGHGYRLYIPIDPIDVKYVEEWKFFSKSWCRRIGREGNAKADEGIYDLARIMRVPGTLNVKNPDNPIQTKLVDCSMGYADRRKNNQKIASDIKKPQNKGE
ncbi:MAG: hypothetical protein MASP_01736 [Candidatus Methanolliviera sp. GoM_asphalt]|nr:MAG: hypothetical protein MASP_01736 [Candidatus Methanolliviera sp. GoM_asphalt]